MALAHNMFYTFTLTPVQYSLASHLAVSVQRPQSSGLVHHSDVAVSRFNTLSNKIMHALIKSCMRNPDEAPAAAICSGPASREMLHGMPLVPMTRTAVLVLVGGNVCLSILNSHACLLRPTPTLLSLREKFEGNTQSMNSDRLASPDADPQIGPELSFCFQHLVRSDLGLSLFNILLKKPAFAG